MEAKKVLMVMYSLDPGGIESFVVNLLEKFDNQLLSVDVCVFKNKVEEETYYEKRILNTGGHIIKLWEGNNHYLGYLKRRYLLYKFLKNNKYDIVHVHGGFADDAMDCFISWLCNVPQIILHAHMSGLEFNRCTFVQHSLHYFFKFMGISNRFVTDRFACSREAARWMFGDKHSEDTRIIPNGVDVDKFIFSQESRNVYRQLLNIDDLYVMNAA